MLLVIFGMTSSKEVIFLRQFYRRILHKYEVPFGDRVLGNGLTHTAQHGQTMYLLPDHRHRFSAALAQAIVDPPSQKLGTGSWVSSYEPPSDARMAGQARREDSSAG